MLCDICMRNVYLISFTGIILHCSLSVCLSVCLSVPCFLRSKERNDIQSSNLILFQVARIIGDVKFQNSMVIDPQNESTGSTVRDDNVY